MNLILVGRNWSKQSGLINAQWIPLGVYMHVCVEVDFKKKRVPSFVLMITSRGSNTKACILYAFECGEYGHRIDPKQNQTDVENSPAAKEVLPNPDPQVGSEQRRPWMLPPNRRRKRNLLPLVTSLL